MSSAEETRFFLWLPRGSVRAIISIQIVVLFWMLLLLPESNRPAHIPFHLYLLLGLVAIFYVSHGNSIARALDPEPSPLGLPGGVIRIVLALGSVGVLSYLHFGRQENLAARLSPDFEQVESYWIQYVGALIGGFSLGYLLRSLPVLNTSKLIKVFMSWLSVIAMLLLVAETILTGIIEASLPQQLDLPGWRTFLIGVVSLYYGFRS